MKGWKKCFCLLIAFLSLWAVEEILGAEAMVISSPAFKHKGEIPAKYTKGTFSVPLEWKNAPTNTKSFALSIVDLHPVANNWVHWLVINIPAKVTSFPEGASKKNMPPRSVELKNSWGDVGYGGPEPPPGTGEHPYVITIYALSVEKLDLNAGTSLSKFEKTVKGNITGKASLTGMFGR
jgi:Raf kinase inhibitor-like YbhB/YbcL family protein